MVTQYIKLRYVKCVVAGPRLIKKHTGNIWKFAYATSMGTNCQRKEH